MSQRGPGRLWENCVQTLGSAEGQGEGWYHSQGVDSKILRESHFVAVFVCFVFIVCLLLLFFLFLFLFCFSFCCCCFCLKVLIINCNAFKWPCACGF